MYLNGAVISGTLVHVFRRWVLWFVEIELKVCCLTYTYAVVYIVSGNGNLYMTRVFEQREWESQAHRQLQQVSL